MNAEVKQTLRRSKFLLVAYCAGIDIGLSIIFWIIALYAGASADGAAAIFAYTWMGISWLILATFAGIVYAKDKKLDSKTLLIAGVILSPLVIGIFMIGRLYYTSGVATKKIDESVRRYYARQLIEYESQGERLNFVPKKFDKEVGEIITLKEMGLLSTMEANIEIADLLIRDDCDIPFKIDREEIEIIANNLV